MSVQRAFLDGMQVEEEEFDLKNSRGGFSGFLEFLSGFFPAASFSHAATAPVRLKGKCSFLL